MEPVDDLTAETVFDARWATILLDRVMVRISEEYRRQSKESAFELLRMYLDLKGDETSVSYQAVREAIRAEPRRGEDPDLSDAEAFCRFFA